MNELEQQRSVARVLDVLTGSHEPLTLTDLAGRADRLLDGAGASVTVGGDLRHGGVLSTVSSTGLATVGEDLQATLGEGPGYTAHRTGNAIAAGHLVDDPTWVMFGHAAAHQDIGGVFAFPLRGARATLGALTLYRRRPGDLTADQHDDATTLATFVTGYVTQDHREEVLLAAEPEISAANQAIGMVSAQLQVDVLAALALLRAHALATDRSLHAVARDVVARRLTLEHPQR